MKFDVYVIDEDGDPVRFKSVGVSFKNFFRGTDIQHTDEDGHATFDWEGVDPGTCTIYVEREECGEYYIEDGDGYTVTYSGD
jgi:hypothetical protein